MFCLSVWCTINTCLTPFFSFTPFFCFFALRRNILRCLWSVYISYVNPYLTHCHIKVLFLCIWHIFLFLWCVKSMWHVLHRAWKPYLSFLLLLWKRDSSRYLEVFMPLLAFHRSNPPSTDAHKGCQSMAAAVLSSSVLKCRLVDLPFCWLLVTLYWTPASWIAYLGSFTEFWHIKEADVHS